ncbi:MAG: hypothetical protein ACHQ02_02300 [Candidatus Limnocylindrales bacterium]
MTRRPGVMTVLLAALLLAAAGPLAAPPPARALSAWDGSINLYRAGVASTQRTWYYCTAADVQVIRNIVRGQSDQSRAGQDRYFAYMREHMRYDVPLKHGVDPAGWTAGMRNFVDDRYRLLRTATFKAFIRSAVRALRQTNLPVALFVDHGNHGWVMHGFSATADPAVTNDFKVLSVRVTGPLWGRQNSTYGYDMKPNKKLTRAQLRDFVTRWHYAPIRMVYEGEFLAIVPTGTGAAGMASSSGPGGQGSTTPGAGRSSAQAGAVTPSPSPSPDAAAGLGGPSLGPIPGGQVEVTATGPEPTGGSPTGSPLLIVVALGALAVVTAFAIASAHRDRRRVRVGPTHAALEPGTTGPSALPPPVAPNRIVGPSVGPALVARTTVAPTGEASSEPAPGA